MSLKLPTLFVVAAGFLFSPFTLSAEEAFSAEQKKAIEAIVSEYLIKNPEVVVDSIRELRRRDEMEQASRKQTILHTMRPALERNPNDPVIGNPDGDVTVVEFFDYRCGFCKRVFPDIQALLKDDGNIRYVLKEWPILGDASVFASRAALAVWLEQTDRYNDFHVAMMKSKGSLTEARVVSLAGDVGIDTAKMAVDMKSSRIDEILALNNQLASGLGITGTPGFIFGDTVMPGAISKEVMVEQVAAMRAKANGG
ncbi:MAG: DsbA family protein [Rhodospirillaceae bacterium]|nr:DsbA family protein [Rhodospirillaceae bacterium]